MSNYRRRYFVKKNQKKCNHFCKIVLKNGKSYVIIELPKFVNNIVNKHTKIKTYKHLNNVFCERELREKRKYIKMVNVKDAANYLIQLFYINKRNCTSAAIQKLLVIAQMKYIKRYNQLMFCDNIVVKPLCLSIDFVSKFYAVNIFDEFNNTILADSLQDNPEKITVIDINNSKEGLSAIYDIEDPLPECCINILREVFAKFSLFSGYALGEGMRQLTLHNKRQAGEIITNEDLRFYVNNSINEEIENKITKYVLEE